MLEASDPQAVNAVLADLRARGQQQLWVLAGDGTLQLIAEFLSTEAGSGWNPAILALAGGRANIVPRDAGGYPAVPALRRALAALRAGKALAEERIVTLQVSQPGEAPRLGFLLVGSAIYEGVRLCSEHRARGTGWLHRSWFADPYTLLKLAVQVWTGRSPLPPYPEVEVRFATGQCMHARLRLVLASSLQLRNALYNPFASRGAGPVRVTAVDATAGHFWRKLPAMLKGRFDERMDMAGGYLSGACEHAELRGLTGYALDGECFAADPSRPLYLRPGIALRVLRA